MIICKGIILADKSAVRLIDGAQHHSKIDAVCFVSSQQNEHLMGSFGVNKGQIN